MGEGWRLNGGILHPSVSPGSGFASLYAPSYEPIWPACEEAEVVINTHSNATGRPSTLDPESPRRRWQGLKAGGARTARSGISSLLACSSATRASSWSSPNTGPAELLVASCRPTHSFKAARVQDASWRTFAGEAMDQLTMLPSEYFARNCYIGASQLLPAEVGRRAEIRIGRIMWGNDYPHSEGFSIPARSAANHLRRRPSSRDPNDAR